MQIEEINGARVLIPVGAIAEQETGFPGAFDSIAYRGYRITLFDEGADDANGLYVGAVYFGPEGYAGDVAKTLGEAIAAIDKAREGSEAAEHARAQFAVIEDFGGPQAFPSYAHARDHIACVFCAADHFEREEIAQEFWRLIAIREHYGR